MTVDKISVIKSAGSYEYNGAAINVAEITGSGKLRGTCKLSDGTEFSFTNSASGLAKRIDNGGKTTKSAVIPCGHADHSTCHGEHKTVAVSTSRREKKHRSIMQALAVLNEFLGYQDGLSMQVNAAWYEFKAEQDRIAEEAEQLRLKREAERKEAEAKKQAEAEAKKQRELINTVVNDMNTLSKYMTQEQAVVILSNKYGEDVVQYVGFGMV